MDFGDTYRTLFAKGDLTPARLASELGLSPAEAEARKGAWDDLLFTSLDKEREQKKIAGWLNASPEADHLALCTQVSREIADLGQAFYHDEDFNFYSNAYLPENLYVFLTALRRERRSTDPLRYLEIGVNKGISALAIAKLAKALSIDVTLTGVDPYFTEGYTEGVLRRIDKETRDKTLAFLDGAGVTLELIEASSRDAFPPLIRAHREFDVIYVDGRHERLFPLVDIGSYITLIPPGGVLLIDDYFWRDVFQLKHLFDKHAVKLVESWKIGAYLVSPEQDNF